MSIINIGIYFQYLFNFLIRYTCFKLLEDFLQVTGTDDAGYVLQRTTPTAISPLKAKSPKVVMQATTHAFYDSTVTLVCQVHSYVPYRVQWSYNGKQQGYDLFYE